MMPSKNKWHQLGEVFKKSTNISLCNLQSALIKMRLRRRSFLVNSARYFKTFSWQTTCGRLLLSYPQLKWIDTCYQWTICKHLQILHVTQFQSPLQFFFNEEMVKSSVRHILLLVRACGISFIYSNKSNVFWNLSMRNATVNGGNIRKNTVYWDRDSRSVTYDQKPEATASEMPAQMYNMWKVSKYGIFSGLYFPLFISNTGKYGLEKTPYLHIFHIVVFQTRLCLDSTLLWRISWLVISKVIWRSFNPFMLNDKKWENIL